MTDQIHPCPVCGTNCRIVGGEDEPGEGGTRHYEPVGEGKVARLRDTLRLIRAEVEAIRTGSEWNRFAKSEALRLIDVALNVTGEADHA